MAMEIFDYNRDLRATIEEDGTVKNLKGNVVGFINADGACGDACAPVSLMSPLWFLKYSIY